MHASLQQLDMGSQVLAVEDDIENLRIFEATSIDSEELQSHQAASNLEVIAPIHRVPNETDIRCFNADLTHLRCAFLHNTLSFTLSGRSLRFVTDPSTAGPYERYVLDSEQGYNSGRCALHPGHPANRPFLAYHTWLIVTHHSFPTPPPYVTEDVETSWRNLAAQIMEEIDRLEDLKEIEWELQQSRPSATVDDEGFRDVDTCRAITSSGRPRLSDKHPQLDSSPFSPLPGRRRLLPCTLRHCWRPR